jgi:hypothetical protein
MTPKPGSSQSRPAFQLPLKDDPARNIMIGVFGLILLLATMFVLARSTYPDVSSVNSKPHTQLYTRPQPGAASHLVLNGQQFELPELAGWVLNQG